MLRLGPLVLCGLCLAAQTDLSPAVLRLARIKQHMKERLQQVPNYTCLQTTERSERPSLSAKFKTQDTIRMEVAEVDGRELFARPGQQFDHSSPVAFARNGTIASGLFATFANALFVADVAIMAFAGDEDIDGRKLVRYDFRVPYLRSGYTIVNNFGRAVVAYHGSFWSDPETLDAFHLRIVADDIPPAMGLQDAGVEIEYQKIRIGGSEALLPRLAALLLTEFRGVQRRNVSTFSQCRQYGSESVLTFDTPAGTK